MAKRSQRKSAKDAIVAPSDARDTEEDALKEALNPLIKKLLDAQAAVTKVKPYDGDIPAYVGSGSYLLDLALNNGLGYPVTKMVHLTGEESTGKTAICMAAAKEVLSLGGVVFWYNQEDGWSWETATMMGIKKGHPNFKLFPPMLAEKCFESIAANLKMLAQAQEQTIVLFVLDSLGGSLTIDRDDLEVEKGRKMGDLQKLAKDFCAKTVPYIPFTQALVMVTNHVYLDISAFTKPGIPKPFKATGGKAVPYRSWLELRTTQGAVQKSSTGKVLYGTIKVEIKKNKGHIKGLFVEIPIFFKQRKNRLWGFDDGMCCINFLVSEERWKMGQRDNKKVILTHLDGVFGTAEELRDRYLADKDFYKEVRRYTETQFHRKFGLD